MRISDWSSDVCSSELYGATSFSTPTAIRSTPTSCAAAFLAATARRAGRSRAGYPRGTEESDMTDTSDPRVCPTPDLDNGREPKHPKHPKRDPRCPPCDPPPLCELDCLVRPEFHCGQELTEDDLNALVRWTDRRLRS